MSAPAYLTVHGDDLEIRIKAVPGAKRDEFAGALGDRLKVRVAQPPEGGRANEAIRALLAARLGVNVHEVELVRGVSSAQKSFRVRCGAVHAKRMLD